MDVEAVLAPWHEAALWPSLSVKALGFEMSSDGGSGGGGGGGGGDGGGGDTHYLLEITSREACWTVSRTFADCAALFEVMSEQTDLTIELPGAGGLLATISDALADPEERMLEIEGFAMALMRSSAGSALPATQRFLEVFGPPDEHVAALQQQVLEQRAQAAAASPTAAAELEPLDDIEVPPHPPPAGADLLVDRSFGLGLVLGAARGGLGGGRGGRGGGRGGGGGVDPVRGEAFHAVVRDFVPLAATGGAGPVEASARVEVGDVVAAVEWINVRGCGYEEVLARLRDAPNPVAVRFCSAGEEEEEEEEELEGGEGIEGTAVAAAAGREAELEEGATAVNAKLSGAPAAAAAAAAAATAEAEAEAAPGAQSGVRGAYVAVLEVRGARELVSVQTFTEQDPFVIARAPGGEERRTEVVGGGGEHPVWAAEHGNVLRFPLEACHAKRGGGGSGGGGGGGGGGGLWAAKLSVALELEIVNDNMVLDEHIGRCSLTLPPRVVLALVAGANKAAGGGAACGRAQGAGGGWQAPSYAQLLSLPVSTGGTLECAAWLEEDRGVGVLDHEPTGRPSIFQVVEQ
jgi:hypothetical protein